MNDTSITMVGNAVTDVSVTTTKSGIETANFRMASTPRRFDRGIGQWVDGDTSYVRVIAWRRLARHVAQCIHKGDPVVVTGTLRVRQWEADDGRKGTSVEIDAAALGHDLTRGTTTFTRPARSDAPAGSGDIVDDAAQEVAAADVAAA